MENKKIVVLGGSFNPPTIAHFKLLQAAVDAIDADKGLFLPAPESYVYRKLARQRHKSETLPDSVRIDLLEAMSADDPRIEVEDYEMHRPRPGFTYESLEYIQEKNPDATIYFIIGSDKLRIIPRWHRVDEFVERFRILTAARRDDDVEELIGENEFLSAHRDAFVFFETPEEIGDVSSTKVRGLMRLGDYSSKDYLNEEAWNILKQAGYIPRESISDFHRDGYEFLSNFYEAPVTYEGLTYLNVEAAFQAQKVFGDEERMQFCSLPPNKAKRRGRRVQLRSDWEEVKVGLMYEIVKAKFEQNPDLAQRLIATGDKKLIEGNTWGDTFWGINIKTGAGENHLGKILMRIREELKGATVNV